PTAPQPVMVIATSDKSESLRLRKKEPLNEPGRAFVVVCIWSFLRGCYCLLLDAPQVNTLLQNCSVSFCSKICKRRHFLVLTLGIGFSRRPIFANSGWGSAGDHATRCAVFSGTMVAA